MKKILSSVLAMVMLSVMAIVPATAATLSRSSSSSSTSSYRPSTYNVTKVTSSYSSSSSTTVKASAPAPVSAPTITNTPTKINLTKTPDTAVSTPAKINLVKTPDPVITTVPTVPTKINLVKSADPVVSTPASSSINLTKPALATAAVAVPVAAVASEPVKQVENNSVPVQSRPVNNTYNTYNSYNQPSQQANNGSILPALAVGAVAGAVVDHALSSERHDNVQYANQSQPVYKPNVRVAPVAQTHTVLQSNVTDKNLYLTVCNTEEFLKAQQWQAVCKSGGDVKGSMCPILSYFRYCEPATAEQVKGLRPAKDKYHNVFLKD